MLKNKNIPSLKIINKKFEIVDTEKFTIPKYDPKLHVSHLAKSKYYSALLYFRHGLKKIIDTYFNDTLNALDIDLFMITPSISSPMGPGSDSEPLPIKFGKHDSYLIDSSQFGFEPLLMNGIDSVYCYLPSMRGEDPDSRHLNQFFHCEAELKCNLEELIKTIENFIFFICEKILSLDNLLVILSKDKLATIKGLQEIKNVKKFPRIHFDDAVELLIKNNLETYINFTKHGNDISAQGEVAIMKILNLKTPLWITHYDRDRVPFYQKVDPKNQNKVLNADLIFPPLTDHAFGGEVVGAGQRQNQTKEMYESLDRQNVDPKSYKWYIDLRNFKEYEITSGFGMGIERFITWLLCRDDIKEVIIYPRIKNTITYP